MFFILLHHFFNKNGLLMVVLIGFLLYSIIGVALWFAPSTLMSNISFLNKIPHLPFMLPILPLIDLGVVLYRNYSEKKSPENPKYPRMVDIDDSSISTSETDSPKMTESEFNIDLSETDKEFVNKKEEQIQVKTVEALPQNKETQETPKMQETETKIEVFDEMEEPDEQVKDDKVQEEFFEKESTEIVDRVCDKVEVVEEKGSDEE